MRWDENRKRRRIGECAHCGKTARLEDDHIPPKNLFSIPRPANLIVVPSCKDCNGGSSKDDEYFRMVTTFREDVAEREDVQSVLATVMRSLQYPEAAGFKATVIQSFKRHQVFSDAGVFWGTKTAFDIDYDRLHRVAERIINGLFYHETGRPLPVSHVPQALLQDGFQEGLFKDFLPIFARLLRKPEPQTIGSVFKYWYGPFPDDPNMSMWVFSIYDQAIFVGLTLEREEAHRRNLERAIATMGRTSEFWMARAGGKKSN
jgi:hypothetical protein